MSISRYRNTLYRTARLIGDYNAIKRGKIGQRIARRIAGKYTQRGLGGIFR